VVQAELIPDEAKEVTVGVKKAIWQILLKHFRENVNSSEKISPNRVEFMTLKGIHFYQ